MALSNTPPAGTPYTTPTFRFGRLLVACSLDKARLMADALDDEEFVRKRGATLASADGDFTRFRGLRFLNPLR